MHLIGVQKGDNRQQHVANKTSEKVCHRNDARTSNEIVAPIFSPSLALFHLCVSHDCWFVQRNRNADLLFWAKKKKKKNGDIGEPSEPETHGAYNWRLSRMRFDFSKKEKHNKFHTFHD